jgi:cytochrome c oxidase subunit 4
MSSSTHVVPVRTYLAVFLALMVLTTITVGAAFVDLGPLNLPIALAIACSKATLVILYFMHVRYGTRLVPVIVGGSILWLLILFAFLLGDYFTRGWLGAGSAWH